MKALIKEGKLIGTCSDEDAVTALADGTADSILTVDPAEVAQLSGRPLTLGQRLQSKINSIGRDLDESATELVKKAPGLCGAAKDKVLSFAATIKNKGDEALAQLRVVAHELTAPEAEVEAPAEVEEAPVVEAPVEAPAEEAPAAVEAVEVVEEEIPTE